MFLKALKIDPSLTDVKLSLAWIYLMGKSRPDIAVKYFKQALKSIQKPEIYFGLGMAYFANNQRVESIDMITRLRVMGQEDFANRLEQSVRENRKVSSGIFDSVEQPEQQAVPSDKTPVATGVKVRLRGKLSEI